MIAIRAAVHDLLASIPGALVESPAGHEVMAEWLHDRDSVQYCSLSSGEQAVVAAALSLHSGALYELFTRADRVHVQRFIGALIEIVRVTDEGDSFIRTVKGAEL